MKTEEPSLMEHKRREIAMDGIFGIDWNHDGQVDIVEDMITADVLGLLDDEANEDSNDIEDEEEE